MEPPTPAAAASKPDGDGDDDDATPRCRTLAGSIGIGGSGGKRSLGLDAAAPPAAAADQAYPATLPAVAPAADAAEENEGNEVDGAGDGVVLACDKDVAGEEAGMSGRDAAEGL